MSRLHVYRASAGSGKTFRLTMEYLKLVLKEDSAYQHILAVTFTNKATTEMKYRVIQELNLLGNGENTPYRSLLVKETNLSERDITLNAKRCLKNILHNYTRFSITTIDKFFQRVISSFNRELGIHVSYQIEIDEDRMLQDAVDSLLSSVEPGSELLNWLKSFSREKIQDGGGWKLKKDIFSLGKNIGNEKFREYYEKSFKKLNDKNFLKNYHDLLYKYTSDYENHLIEIGKKGLSVIKKAGLSESDFLYKTSGPAAAFLKMKNKRFDMLDKPRVLKAVEDSSAFHKKEDRTEIIEASVCLQPLLAEAVSYYDNNVMLYETAGLINKQLYTLGILVDLKNEMQKISSEREVILISESNSLIHKIIDDSDTPFIYEKMGIYYQYFMIDEFQDTSDLQWNNFKPLLENSLSEGHFSMVVGDVKQAIYRFRNGDWNLLQNKIAIDFPDPVEKNLDTNWRSFENIVRFNNTIFSSVPVLVQKILEDDGYTENDSFLTSLYADSLQEIGKKDNKEKGYVRMYFSGYAEQQEEENKNTHNEESEDDEFSVLEDMASQIELLQENGVPSGKITILINKKDEAARVAAFLMEKGNKFNVISDNSLILEDDPVVSFIISVFSLLLDPENQIALSCINYQYRRTILPELSKNNLKPSFPQRQKSELSDAENSDTEIFNEGDFLTTSSDSGIAEEKISDLFEKKDNELNNFLKSNYFRVTLLSMNLQELVVKIG
ncbi:MAG: UvrD-helicase domain-containing protein, partial [Prolixibacteraceae bacterium]|nr:UvrD-helicase domain-containing protein [Prolixibacteraceae bacterium]